MRRGLDIDVSVADLRTVHDHHGRRFDAVLACDNSLPHLLTDTDLLAALVQMRSATAPGGVCVVSARDYGALIAAGELAAPCRRAYGTRRHQGREIEVVQEWTPLPQPDGRLLYDLTIRFAPIDRAAPLSPPLPARTTRYHAVALDHLVAQMLQAGFTTVDRLDDRFFQPLLVGRSPRGMPEDDRS